MKPLLVISVCIALLSGCNRQPDNVIEPSDHGPHYNSTDLLRLRVGMTASQTTNVLGEADMISANGNVTYWIYHSHDEHNKRDYFVKFVGSKVYAYGEKGDFESDRELRK